MDSNTLKPDFFIITDEQAHQMVDLFEEIIYEKFEVDYRYPDSERIALVLDIQRNPTALWAFDLKQGFVRKNRKDIPDEYIRYFIPTTKYLEDYDDV